MCESCAQHKKFDMHAAIKRGIKFADSSGDGVWRTINGSPVFIKEGQSAEEAMKEKIVKLEGQIKDVKATTPKIYESSTRQAVYNAKQGIKSKDTNTEIKIPERRPDGARVVQSPSKGSSAERRGMGVGHRVYGQYADPSGHRENVSGKVVGFVPNKGKGQDVVISNSGGKFYFIAEGNVFKS